MICDIHGQDLMAHPGEKHVWYSYAVLLAPSVCDLALRMFTAEGEVAGMIAGNSKSEAMVL